MAMTVAELLAEPQLGLSVLAGSEGLGNRITWAHTSDLPRLWEWVTGGELMMTNGMSIPADRQGQVTLAHALVQAGASALAIGEKMHAPELRPEFIDVCNRLPLPVLNVPYPLPFIAIARAVADSSAADQSRRLRQTARIYDLLRRASPVEEHGPALVHGIAAELDAQVFIADQRCLHPWHPRGKALQDDVAQALRAFLTRSREATKKFQWFHDGDRRITVMDIPTHEEALLIVAPRPEAQPDATVLLHAATVLGLQLSQTVLALEGQRRLAASFLVEAFEGRYSTSEVEHRLQSFGVPTGEVLVASISGNASTPLPDADIRLWRHGFPNACLRRSELVHVIVSARCTEEDFRHALPPGATIGLSQPTDVTGLQHAAQQSLWALGTARATGHGLVRYTDGPSWWGLSTVAEGQALVHRVLGPVLEYEKGKTPDLLTTLRTYLEQQRSWQKTATALFAHRQTIIYRIRKIGELTGLDMAETSTLAQLWFAVQIYDAMNPQNPAQLPKERAAAEGGDRLG